MHLPKKSGVNFVDNMDIIQEFEQLPNGEWVLKTDDMIVEMTLMKIMQGFQIRRTTRYSDYAFDELPQQLFKRKGAEIKEADAMMRKLKATGVFKEVSIFKDQINIPL